MTREIGINLGFSGLLLALGLGGALVARQIGAPMPFMLGALAASAVMAGLFGARYPANYAFPTPVRLAFIGVIGVMIGSQVDPAMFANAGGVVVSLSVVALFVLASQFMNLFIFHRIGGYDRATAWFAGSPGGLIEAITMGEEAGGDVRVLTLLQFLRIIFVVSLLPIAFSIWHGAPVGSAAGISFGSAVGGVEQLPLVALLVVVGLGLKRVLHLPAGQLIGPLIAAAIVSWFGWADLNMPPWLLAAAQVVLGVHLGVRFHGVNRALLIKAAQMSLLSVSAMLALGFVLALAVGWATGISLEVLIISYAPGGVTEMGLVAISLAANPTLVTLHHLFRITLTVLLLSMAKRFGIIRL